MPMQTMGRKVMHVLEALACITDILDLREDTMEREIKSVNKTHAQEMAAQRMHFEGVITAMRMELDACNVECKHKMGKPHEESRRSLRNLKTLCR